MGVIATLLPNSTHLQRLRLAIRDRHEVAPCDSWASLLEVCEQRPVRVAVVDVYGAGKAAFERVRQFKQRLPRLTLIVYIGFTPERVHDVFHAGRLGVDALVVADQDDAPRSLLALVEQAESRSLAGVLQRSLADVDASVRDAVLLGVARGHERLSPAGLARLLALPRRALTQRLADAGFPPPQRLLTWGRLMVAAHLLEDAHRSADRVAASLGFPSGSAFRNTCQRYLHATPGQIRSRGGASYVIAHFLREVHGARQRRGAPSRMARPARRTLSLAV